MNFTGKEDIEKPIDEVFAALIDYELFERQVLHRGHEISRIDRLSEVGIGMGWRIGFSYRNHKRELLAVISGIDSPESISFDLKISGLDAVMVVDLIELSKKRTRMSLNIELQPRTITALVLVQSLRLRKASLNETLKRRLAEFTERIEERSGPVI